MLGQDRLGYCLMPPYMFSFLDLYHACAERMYNEMLFRTSARYNVGSRFGNMKWTTVWISGEYLTKHCFTVYIDRRSLFNLMWTKVKCGVFRAWILSKSMRRRRIQTKLTLPVWTMRTCLVLYLWWSLAKQFTKYRFEFFSCFRLLTARRMTWIKNNMCNGIDIVITKIVAFSCAHDSFNIKW